jgi:1-hydroxycarotenoid 3,4-desaturase
MWSARACGVSRAACTSSRVLAGLVGGQGGRLHYRAEVARLIVRDGRVAGVQLSADSATMPGETLEADAVVFNGDTAALHAGLLGHEARRAVPATPVARRSLSALTWHLVAPARGFPLLRHNVFFGGDSRREFDELFHARRLPSDPSIYVCAQDRADDGEPATAGRPERLMCLVNAPATADTRPLAAQEIEQCEQRTFERLARCGLRLLRQPSLTTLSTPQDFARRFPATGGALYGPVSHGWRAAFTRPASHSRIPGLYLAGGSTHPGAGVPMAALSGHLAAASVMADRPQLWLSMPIRHQAAMPGGTSTRSATTDSRR